MNYSMTEPCNECPFLVGSGFTFRSLNDHASGEFACHKACEINDDSGCYEAKSSDTPHCAGALIFLEKRNQPHQMMRICERLGLYDRSRLNMDAKVVGRAGDCRKGTR